MKNSEKKKTISAMGHALMNFSVSLADLVLLNVLFVLFSLPVVTIPAALTAMNTIAYRFAKGLPPETQDDENAASERKGFEGSKKLYGVFRLIVAAEFKRSLPTGLALLAVEAVCVFIMLNVKAEGTGTVIVAFAVVSLAAAVIFGSYAFTMLGLLDISVSQSVRNAVILLFDNLAANVVSALILAVLTLAIIALFPFSFPFLLCIHFSLSAYLVQRRIRFGIDKCIG